MPNLPPIINVQWNANDESSKKSYLSFCLKELYIVGGKVSFFSLKKSDTYVGISAWKYDTAGINNAVP